ncbi:MAG: ribosome-binding factor A [Candidatus Paceibacterota bacterium]
MTDRHDRVVSLIRELAATFIQAESNPDPLITVTHVTTSPDYRQVTVYVTTIPEGREDDALIFLKRHGTALRQFIKKKSNLKIIPHLDFAVDAGERHRQHIDELTEEIHKTNES